MTHQGTHRPAASANSSLDALPYHVNVPVALVPPWYDQHPIPADTSDDCTDCRVHKNHGVP